MGPELGNFIVIAERQTKCPLAENHGGLYRNPQLLLRNRRSGALQLLYRHGTGLSVRERRYNAGIDRCFPKGERHRPPGCGYISILPKVKATALSKAAAGTFHYSVRSAWRRQPGG